MPSRKITIIIIEQGNSSVLPRLDFFDDSSIGGTEEAFKSHSITRSVIKQNSSSQHFVKKVAWLDQSIAVRIQKLLMIEKETF